MEYSNDNLARPNGTDWNAPWNVRYTREPQQAFSSVEEIAHMLYTVYGITDCATPGWEYHYRRDFARDANFHSRLVTPAKSVAELTAQYSDGDFNVNIDTLNTPWQGGGPCS